MLLFLCLALVYGFFEFNQYKRGWRTVLDIMRDSFENLYSRTYSGYWLGYVLRMGALIELTIGMAAGAWIWSGSIWNAVAIITGAILGAHIVQATVNRFYDPLEELSKTFDYEKMNR